MRFGSYVQKSCALVVVLSLGACSGQVVSDGFDGGAPSNGGESCNGPTSGPGGWDPGAGGWGFDGGADPGAGGWGFQGGWDPGAGGWGFQGGWDPGVGGSTAGPGGAGMGGNTF